MFEDRLDPALRQFAAARTDLSASMLGIVRGSLNQRRADASRGVDTVGVEIENREAQSIPVRIYRGGAVPANAVIYCHSGAFVLGNLDTDHRQCVEFARRGRCTVISLDYRLAPEHPYPAGVDDASGVLDWVADNGASLGIDTTRLAVAGSSAGAALAALLAQRAAHGTAPPVVFQLLHQPVLDDRPMPSKTEFATTPGFDGPAVTQMWQHYVAGESVRADAVPARADDLAGVASALITCSELGPAPRRGGRLCVAPHVGRGCHGTPRLPRHLPRLRLTAARMGNQPAAVRATRRGVEASAASHRQLQRDGGVVGVDLGGIDHQDPPRTRCHPP